MDVAQEGVNVASTRESNCRDDDTVLYKADFRDNPVLPFLGKLVSRIPR